MRKIAQALFRTPGKVTGQSEAAKPPAEPEVVPPDPLMETEGQRILFALDECRAMFVLTLS